MLEQLAAGLDAVVAYAPVWGFLLIFFFMAVESSFVPFPSEIVMLPAGFLAARGELTCANGPVDLTLAVAAGLAGSLAGAFFNYGLSARLGKPFLLRFGRWFFVKPDALERACEVFNRYGAMTTFVCRLVPVIRQLISIPAGLARMPLGRFALFTGLGAGVWTAILAGVGYAIGLRTLAHGEKADYLRLVREGKAMVDSHLVWIILGAVLSVAAYWAVSKIVMRRGK